MPKALRVQTSASGRRFVDTKEVVRGVMERIREKFAAGPEPLNHRHMDVLYKCGCEVRSYSEAEHTCGKHGKHIKRISRVVEFY